MNGLMHISLILCQKPLGRGLNTYCILEKGSLVPNLVEAKEDASKIWSMYFDGSRNKNGLGVGVMLVSPTLEKH